MSTTSISADQLMAECLKVKYKRLLARPDIFPSEENWDYIIAHKMTDIGTELYRKYLVSATIYPSQRCDYHQIALKKFPEYLSAVDRRYAVSIIYSDVTSLPDATVELIIDCQLFDARKLTQIAGHKGLYVFAVKCLAAFQPTYTESDLVDMITLKNVIDNPTPLGQVVANRALFKQEIRYICPNGHANDSTCEYCQTEGCGLNINGLTQAQAQLIDEFDHRIQTLKSLLK